MSFSSPAWLLLLLLVPVVIALHALSIRWRSTPVSSLVFWNEVLRERKASLRIRRLLTSLILLLEILGMAALAFALGGPLLAGVGRAGTQDVVLVLDATASMQAREGSRTRFDIARERGRELADGLRGGARMAVVLAEKAPRLLSPFTADKAALRRLLRDARAVDEAGDVAASTLFALSLRDPRRGGRVVLETDGAFDDLPGVDTSLPWLRVDLVGTPRPNVGITQMSFRLGAGAGEGYQLFLAVKNAGGEPVSVPLAVSASGRTVVDRTVELAAGERRGITIPWTGPVAGRMEAALRTQDALSRDDRAYAVFSPARRVQVSVAGPRPYFVQQALSSLPGVAVSTRDTPGAEAAPADVTVLVDMPAPPLEKGNFILFNSVPPNLPLRITGSLNVPPITGWSRTDPLLDSVSLGNVTIGQALALDPGAGFSVLAASATSPLILSWDHSGVKALLFAFDPGATDLPLRPGFPVLLANALSWFFPTWLQAHADQSAAGDPRVIPAEGASAVTVTKPDGSLESVPAVGPSAVFFDTDETGFYRVDAGGVESEFAVNLSSDSETDLAPRFAPTATGPEAGSREAVPVPVWPAVAAAALGLLLLEWLVWMWRPGRPLSA